MAHEVFCCLSVNAFPELFLSLNLFLEVFAYFVCHCFLLFFFSCHFYTAVSFFFCSLCFLGSGLVFFPFFLLFLGFSCYAYACRACYRLRCLEGVSKLFLKENVREYFLVYREVLRSAVCLSDE